VDEYILESGGLSSVNHIRIDSSYYVTLRRLLVGGLSCQKGNAYINSPEVVDLNVALELCPTVAAAKPQIEHERD
jgi:hypothetical protein